MIYISNVLYRQIKLLFFFHFSKSDKRKSNFHFVINAIILMKMPIILFNSFRF